MLHSTDVRGVQADSWYDRWNKNGIGKSVHFFVDNTGIYHYMECNKRAAHSGGTANDTHMAFEMCEPLYYDDEGYFIDCWHNAVSLCVRLCLQYGLTEKDIISHEEGHALGVASDHGDPMHWWKYYGKTMDDFRKDVAKKIKEEAKEVRYKYLSDIPDNWGAGEPRATVKALMNAGVIVGNDGEGENAVLDLSHDMLRMIIINYRAGAYDKAFSKEL